MISQALRIHGTTVLRHLKDYEQSEKLTPENVGSSGYLSVIQTMVLIEHLIEHTYHHTYQILAYVMEHFGVQYSIPRYEQMALATICRKVSHLSLMKQSSKPL